MATAIISVMTGIPARHDRRDYAARPGMAD